MHLLRRAVAGLLAVGLALLVWGVAVEPRLIDEQHREAPIPALPAAWEGRRVALFSDIQVGMWLDNVGTARRIVGRLVADPPAAVLLAGDYLYSASPDLDEQVETVLGVLGPLPRAGIPTYAVLGNHDVGAGAADDLRAAFERVGIELLRNDAVALPPPGGGGGDALYVVGLGPHVPGRDRPAAALAQVPDGAPRLVLMHNPESFAALPAGTAPLAMAGHTHGGQVRVPFFPQWSWMALTSEDEVHVDGWIDGYGAPGNRLYVTRGVGMSRLPIRLFCPPELTIFTLRAA